MTRVRHRNKSIYAVSTSMRGRRLRNLHRRDDTDSSTHGWLAQVQRRHAIINRMFSDGLYGGRRASLRAAVAWRDALLNALHDEHYALWRRNGKRRNNTSGIVGVGRYAVSGQPHAAYWLAFWNNGEGTRQSRKFSISKYGEGRARALAIAARRDALKTLHRLGE